MNKKGAEKYLSIWLFFVFAFLGAGIVIGVVINQASEINSKKIETDVLVNRIADCIIENGNIDETIFSNDFNIFSKCYLNEEMLRYSNNYYISVGVFDIDSCKSDKDKIMICENSLKTLDYGSLGLRTDCEIQKALKSTKGFPECTNKFIYSLRNNKEIIIKIETGSKQTGARSFMETIKNGI